MIRTFWTCSVLSFALLADRRNGYISGSEKWETAILPVVLCTTAHAVLGLSGACLGFAFFFAIRRLLVLREELA